MRLFSFHKLDKHRCLMQFDQKEKEWIAQNGFPDPRRVRLALEELGPKIFEIARVIGATNLVREFERIIFKELDMLIEAGSIENLPPTSRIAMKSISPKSTGIIPPNRSSPWNIFPGLKWIRFWYSNTRFWQLMKKQIFSMKCFTDH